MNGRIAAAVAALMAASLLAAPGCGKKEEAAKGAAARPAVAGVGTETVRAGTREATVELVGTVRARTAAAVAPQVMGRIVSMPVAEGMRLAAGAPVAVIDDAAQRAQVAAAQGAVAEAQAAKEEAERAIAQAVAGRDLAEKTHARFVKLLEGKVVTPQEFDEVDARRTVAAKDYERALEKRAQVEARIGQAKGQLKAAEAQLSWSRVTAPFAGVVVEKKADAGGMAVPGVPLVVLEDPRAYRIEAAVPETLLSSVRAGTKVEVTLDSQPGKTFRATVSEVVPSVDPGSRTFTAKAALDAPGLRSGLFGRVRVPSGSAAVLSVPKGAIVSRGGFDALFVVGGDGVARLTMVRTGQALGDRVEILSGLDDGARVAVSGVDRLADGAAVEGAR